MEEEPPLFLGLQRGSVYNFVETYFYFIMPLCDFQQVQMDAIENLDDFTEKDSEVSRSLILQEMHLMQSESGSSSSSALFERYIEGSPLAAQLAAIPPSSALVLSEMSRIRAAERETSSPLSTVPIVSAIDIKRHEDFPEPPAGDDPIEWERAVRRAETTIEAQSILGMNVSLSENYAVKAWGDTTRNVSAYIDEAKRRVISLQKQTEDTNAARAASVSGPIAQKMTLLEKKTRQIAETNFELEMAIAGLESDSKRTRRDI